MTSTPRLTEGIPGICQEIQPTCHHRWNLHAVCVGWTWKCSGHGKLVWPQQHPCDQSVSTNKDFSISCFGLGALYTHNKEVGLCHELCSISGITQDKPCWLLQDRKQIEKCICSLTLTDALSTSEGFEDPLSQLWLWPLCLSQLGTHPGPVCMWGRAAPPLLFPEQQADVPWWNLQV